MLFPFGARHHRQASGPTPQRSTANDPTEPLTDSSRQARRRRWKRLPPHARLRTGSGWGRSVVRRVRGCGASGVKAVDQELGSQSRPRPSGLVQLAGVGVPVGIQAAIDGRPESLLQYQALDVLRVDLVLRAHLHGRENAASDPAVGRLVVDA